MSKCRRRKLSKRSCNANVSKEDDSDKSKVEKKKKKSEDIELPPATLECNVTSTENNSHFEKTNSITSAEQISKLISETLQNNSDSVMAVSNFSHMNQSKNSAEEKCSNSDNFPRKQKGRPPKIHQNSNCTESIEKIDNSSVVKQDCDIINTHNEKENESTSRRTRSSTNKLSIEKEFSSESECESDSEIDTASLLKKRKNNFKSRRKRKRGRPKSSFQKIDNDADYTPHHEYLRETCEIKKNKSESIPLEPINKIKVTCAKCNLEMFKNQWTNHNLKEHNDLGWLEGEPNPDFENNEKLMRQSLFVTIKKKKGILKCEKCNEVRRSVDGYLSHIQKCGKSQEEINQSLVTCPGCQELVTIPTLKYHTTVKHVRDRKELIQEDDFTTEARRSEPKTKRKAAEKATSKISEFTALTKEDKDDQSKKSLLNHQFLRKIVQKPKLTKVVPGLLYNKWKKDLDNGQSAVCSQLGCNFSCRSLREINDHYLQCNFIPQESYICKICKFKTLEKRLIVNHVTEHHPMEDLDDVKLSESSGTDGSLGSDDETLEKNIRTLANRVPIIDNFRTNAFKFVLQNGNYLKSEYIFKNAFKWTLEFERKNYQVNLFEEYKANNFELIDSKELYEWLPELEESMSMKTIKTGNDNSSDKWKKWKRFEGNCVDENPMFFVGGPVWALAWLPIPNSLAFSEKISQYIAVSTHKSMESEYSVVESYKGKNIIQIWNVGDLNHKSDSKFSPKLAYAIAYEGGTVWSLEWCPSGCYNDSNLSGSDIKSKRLGLLATACSDGCIRIYSLIFPEDLPVQEDTVHNSSNSESGLNDECCPIYKTDPVLVLVVNMMIYQDNKQTWQVTKLSWTKEKSHDVIVAGFSNGYVGLWDLTSKSPLLRFEKNKTVFLQPYRHFHAHFHAVTMIQLIPHDEKRFLVTGSLDRFYKYWDLENIASPRISCQKSFITDGAWLNNWGCAILAYDDGLCLNHNYIYCLPQREYTYNHFNLLPSNSTTYAIDTSDFGNSIANGTVAGEVLAMFPSQLLYVKEMEKTLRYKRTKSLVASVEVKDFHKEINEQEKKDKEYDFMPSTYEESKNRFGLIFHDKMSNFNKFSSQQSRKKTLTSDMMQSVPMEQYPFMSVNRVSWNPNAWSFLWLAVAYQNGFVQLLSFKSLACTAEWNKQLQSQLQL